MTKQELVARIRNNFPAELITLDQWVLWRIEVRDDKPTKVPYAITGARAASDEPNTWATFEVAEQAYFAGNYDGLGFMFSAFDPYAGVDFDKCVHNGTVDAEKWAHIQCLASYTEYSQSGQGVHVIVRAKLPAGGRKSNLHKIEMYDQLRFFVVTGDVLLDMPDAIHERQQEIEQLHRTIFPTKEQPQARERASTPLMIDDRDLLERMFASQHGGEIQALWNGAGTRHNGDDSAADLALCNYLAFWTGNDAERMDRLFRQSGLMRPKWDRAARTGEKYGEGTIARAIEGTPETFGSRPYTNGRTNGHHAPTEWEMSEPVEESQIDPLKYRQEDGGILDAWVDHHGHKWIYATGADRWYYWQGIHWQVDDQLFIQKNLRELLDEMNQRCSQIIKETPDEIAKIVQQYKGVDRPESAEKQIQALQKGSTIAEGMRKATKRTNGRIASIEGMARSVNTKPISAFDIDESLNLANGTLSLRSLELHPHRAEDLFTYKLDYEYDANAKCPLFEKFIAEVLVKEGTEETDRDLLALFQELLGYSLTTQTKREVMVWMFGDGGNGKSVVISVIEALLGPMAASVDLQAIGMPGNYELADIPGKRVIFSTEAERGGTMAEGYLKRIVTGDTMKARPIYGTQFSFKSTAKVWWAMNDRPAIKDTTDSIWRRMKLLPFHRKFEEGKNADVNLPQKLCAELPGILNWAIAGLVRLSLQDKFTTAEAAETAKAQYREESNPVARWVNTMVTRTSHPATLQGALYENFCQWLSKQNEKPLTSNQFGRDLSRLKIAKTRRGAGWMYNLALLNYRADEPNV